MKKDEAIAALKQEEPVFLKKAKTTVAGKDTYICPECGNGSGKKGDGITLDPNNTHEKKYKCFKCGLYDDVIGLWIKEKGVDFNTSIEELCSYFGYTLDKYEKKSSSGKKSAKVSSDTNKISKNNKDKDKDKDKKNKENEKPISSEETKKETSHMNSLNGYFDKCNKEIGKSSYFKDRGLSDATIKRFNLGIDSSYSKSTGGQVWCAAIIPTSEYSYVARNTDKKASKENRFRKSGSSGLYLSSLKDKETPVVVVEGELDAISIAEAGGSAIGLGSVANIKQFVNYLKQNTPEYPPIIALDEDEEGIKATDRICQLLDEEGLLYVVCSLYPEGCKDANDTLVQDRFYLIESIRIAEEESSLKIQDIREKEYNEYLKSSVASYIDNFKNGISDSINTPYISTGFFNLDNKLGGGLFEGMYIIGAISSLGKTTFVMQMADQIAADGTDVIVFSLEMARYQLMAKSISRFTCIEAEKNNIQMNKAKTSRGITTGARYSCYSDDEKDLIEKAISRYSVFANHIFIHEGIGDVGTEKIRETVEKHIKLTGRKPVVIIDYVQILTPYDPRATEKQHIDRAVLDLKRLSRDFKIPLIGISSFNRANYRTEVSMEAFKESGALEYGSDVLMGIQFKGAGDKDFDINAEKKKNPRKIELVILKNREGSIGDKIVYDYYPLFNYFKEV